MFEDLAKSWEALAGAYKEKAGKNFNGMTIERLLAQADTFEVCASQLKAIIKASEEVKK